MKGMAKKARLALELMGKKGQAMQAGVNWVVGLMILAIVLSLALIVLGNLDSTATAIGQNGTRAGIRAFNQVADLVPNIGTIVAVGVILLVLFAAVGFFIFGKGRR